MTDLVDELIDLRTLLANGEARQIRERAGLSAAEVALQLEVTPATITRWELGTRKPQGSNARRYGRLLRKLASKVPA